MNISSNMGNEGVKKVNQIANVFAVLMEGGITMRGNIFSNPIMTCEMTESMLESRVEYPIKGVIQAISEYTDLYTKIFGPGLVGRLC